LERKDFPMAHAATNPKQHAHELIDRMAPGQVSAVVGLLEIMLDPFARALAPPRSLPLTAVVALWFFSRTEEQTCSS
jgi:hypothetical protein